MGRSNNKNRRRISQNSNRRLHSNYRPLSYSPVSYGWPYNNYVTRNVYGNQTLGTDVSKPISRRRSRVVPGRSRSPGRSGSVGTGGLRGLFGRVAVGVSEYDPTRVCVERSQRKEVMHATGRTGGRVSRPRFSRKSKISCKGS